MSLLKKILTAIRGGVREAGESVVDANALRIYEQEISEAEGEIKKAKSDLTEVMAKEMQSTREVERIKAEIKRHETYAEQALAKGEEALALEVAEKIAGLETDLSAQVESLARFTSHVARLKELIKKSEKLIIDHQRQLSLVKTTETVQRATASITENFSNSNADLMSAKESLERIKKRQEDFDDRLKAGEALASEFSDQSLEDKLKQAGIRSGNASDANAVLARLKAKNQSV